MKKPANNSSGNARHDNHMNGESRQLESVVPGKMAIRQAAADCHDAFIALRRAIIRQELALRGTEATERGQVHCLSIVSAILFLGEHRLAENEIISLDLYGEEGYELRRAVKLKYEGATSLGVHPLLASSGYERDLGNVQFNGLMDEIGKADLAIQFINTFPTRDHDEGDRLNLRVLIMRRETLYNAPGRTETWEPRAAPETPVCKPPQRQGAPFRIAVKPAIRR